MNRLTLPLFRFDAGWLFILAGLAVCAAGILLPAQADLRVLREQTDRLRDEEDRAYARLKAHSDFMDQVDRADPALIRRLAATQLNLVPETDTPVLLAASATVPVTHWIESAVQLDLRPPKSAPTSTLSKLANGPYRLWMFGGGIMFVFMGLLLAPGASTTHACADEDETSCQHLSIDVENENQNERPVSGITESIAVSHEYDDGSSGETIPSLPRLTESVVDMHPEKRLHD